VVFTDVEFNPSSAGHALQDITADEADEFRARDLGLCGDRVIDLRGTNH
jgi:hypothetical protein